MRHSAAPMKFFAIAFFIALPVAVNAAAVPIANPIYCHPPANTNIFTGLAFDGSDNPKISVQINPISGASIYDISVTVVPTFNQYCLPEWNANGELIHAADLPKKLPFSADVVLGDPNLNDSIMHADSFVQDQKDTQGNWQYIWRVKGWPNDPAGQGQLAKLLSSLKSNHSASIIITVAKQDGSQDTYSYLIPKNLWTGITGSSPSPTSAILPLAKSVSPLPNSANQVSQGVLPSIWNSVVYSTQYVYNGVVGTVSSVFGGGGGAPVAQQNTSPVNTIATPAPTSGWITPAPMFHEALPTHVPSASPSGSPAVTSSPTISPKVTASPKGTAIPTNSPTVSPSNLPLYTYMPTPTSTVSPVNTYSPTPTTTNTPTTAPSQAPASTYVPPAPTNSSTPTPTPTNTVTPTPSTSKTPSPSPKTSSSPSPSPVSFNNASHQGIFSQIMSALATPMENVANVLFGSDASK